MARVTTILLSLLIEAAATTTATIVLTGAITTTATKAANMIMPKGHHAATLMWRLIHLTCSLWYVKD